MSYSEMSAARELEDKKWIIEDNEHPREEMISDQVSTAESEESMHSALDKKVYPDISPKSVHSGRPSRERAVATRSQNLSQSDGKRQRRSAPEISKSNSRPSSNVSSRATSTTPSGEVKLDGRSRYVTFPYDS